MKKVSEYLNTRCAFNDSVADTLIDIEEQYAKSINDEVLQYIKLNLLEEASLLIFHSIKFDMKIHKEGADLLLKRLQSAKPSKVLNLPVMTDLLQIVTSSEDSEKYYHIESPDFNDLFKRPMDDF